jgi:hypothetical protein
LARTAQALVKGFEHRMIANGHEGTHIQGRPPMRAPTPSRTGPSQGAAVPMEGRDANEGRTALAASGAQRWKSVRPFRTRWRLCGAGCGVSNIFRCRTQGVT